MIRRICSRCIAALMIVFLAVLAIGCTEPDVSSESRFRHFEGQADVVSLSEVVNELSDPSYSGRMTGTPGSAMAINYVAKKMEAYGLEAAETIGDYTQEYTQKVNLPYADMTLEVVDASGESLATFFPYQQYREALFSSHTDNDKEDTTDLVLVTNREGFTAETLENKIALVHSSMFTNESVFDMIRWADLSRASAVMFNRDNKYNDIYYVKSASLFWDVYQQGFDEDNGLASFYVDDDAMGVLENAITNGHQVHYDLNFEMSEVETANVIGEIKGNPGSETIVIGAHMDHVGGTEQTYCPGALDNASGVSVMLEVARVLAESEVVPRKNLVFIAFNGEETGLIGSRHYANNSIYEIEDTMMINLDMVGSRRIQTLSIESGGYNTDRLDDMLIDLARENDLDYNRGHEGRSDHINFAEAGAEAVLLINYDMEDIHTPEDAVDGDIDFDYMARIADLILQFIDEHAF